MPSNSILKLAVPNISLQNQLVRELGISRILAQILINRRITAPDAARSFLKASLGDLSGPQLFSDMPKAVGLVRKSVDRGEKIMVFGDYDVDGITSTVLLKNTLAGIGADVAYRIPHRVKEGYGLNPETVRMAVENRVKLVITADCGIANHREIAALRRENIDVVVTDHHEPQDNSLPAASCIINPKTKHSGYPYRDLAGVGVSYRFAQALAGSLLKEDLDLVTLGTIADSVPLTGENRIMVKEGLACLPQTARAGLRVLIDKAGIGNKKFNATYVSFIIAPRLNAPGRLDHAELSLKLLSSQDAAEAAKLAEELETFNRQRQKVESKILEEAEDLINRQVNFKKDKVIVIAKEDWHQGVLGIVASKLVDRFYRPAVVISLTDNLCKGSARSIRNFHLFDALMASKDLLNSFGGHAHAAGITITRDNIDEFRKSINKLASDRLKLEDLFPTRDIDLEVPLGDLNASLCRELEGLEPFGMANPEPLFYSRNLKLKSQLRLLNRGTLKFWVTDGAFTFEAIAFGMSQLKESLIKAESFDLIYTPKIDSWRGEESIILEVKDIFLK
ncbi:MAG: single-stranded-DNA-specific exonuclease RecJ [Candidatus Omnitrophica bacterium]|jgi:single-stranded-DNA-specific exonuclease|nr:single-stranded-DNA-specific exonuclease RecJ [Candidatus Omnitrophota bacterium]MDD5724922.1 single-stranded-DNA-specific exonuclease RecJ [Candidatus Omnitrophota bacterium]